MPRQWVEFLTVGPLGKGDDSMSSDPEEGGAREATVGDSMLLGS